MEAEYAKVGSKRCRGGTTAIDVNVMTQIAASNEDQAAKMEFSQLWEELDHLLQHIEGDDAGRESVIVLIIASQPQAHGLLVLGRVAA